MSKTESSSENDMKPTNLSAHESSTACEVSSQEQRVSPQGRTYIAPIPGFTWNPLLKYPRNNKCPCLSGKKFKTCCLGLLPRVVSLAAAQDYQKQMEAPDLVFLTKENQEAVRGRVAPEVLKRFETEGVEAPMKYGMEVAAEIEFKNVAADTKALMEANRATQQPG